MNSKHTLPGEASVEVGCRVDWVKTLVVLVGLLLLLLVVLVRPDCCREASYSTWVGTAMLTTPLLAAAHRPLPCYGGAAQCTTPGVGVVTRLLVVKTCVPSVPLWHLLVVDVL